MRRFFLLLVSGLCILLGLSGLVLGAQAASPAQITYATPTPGADGRIIYIVQEGDNCLRISLLTGVSVENLILNNHLDQNCTIRPGQELLLGFAESGQASPTPGPSPTPTASGPTPTPVAGGNGVVCLLLFDDHNGDGLRQEEEPAVGGGAVSLTSADGLFSRSETTTGGINADTGEPPRICFEGVPMGEYTVSAAVPEGYNPTTALSYSLTVVPGDTSQVAFGVQERVVTSSGQRRNSPLLGLGGILLILGGIGLAFFAWRMRKP